jgi:hypothetical protein
MGSNPQLDRLKGELYRLVDSMRADLDRVEILIAGMEGFYRSVPDYEPRFRHMPEGSLRRHEIGRRAASGGR